MTLGVGYTEHFDRYRDLNRNESYFATLRRNFGIAEVGLMASYGRYDYRNYDRDPNRDPVRDENDMRVAMTVSFSTFTDPATLATRVSSDRIARQGGIRARTYYDTNQNGIRDVDEPLVPGVKVLHAGQRDPYYTAREGETAGVATVGAGGWTDVAVDRGGLPSAALNPGSKGVAVLPRPGVVSEIELPIVSTAGIEGRVDLNLGRDKRALPNVKVQVVRRAGPAGPETVVAEGNTEFDGAFSLSNVPIGDYIIRVEPEQAKQIGSKTAVEQTIRLTPDTGILDGVALKLTRS